MLPPGRRATLHLRILAATVMVVAGCRGPNIIRHQIVSAPHAVGCAPGECDNASEIISVTYLGTSGILIEHSDHVLLAAPFFSNPNLAGRWPSGFQWLQGGPRIAPDTAIIERLLPRSADRALAILVGHGHYDHLLDVPYIATHRAKSAIIFGGPSVGHMLMGEPGLRSNPSRVVTIPREKAGDPDRNGEWFYSSDSAFRFVALVAGHAPTYKVGPLSFTFAASRVSTDRDSLPHTAAQWKMGEPYAFLIDVLSDPPRRTVFRIYFQDAPSEPPLGFPSALVLAEHRTDLAILCAATSSNVNSAPDALVRVLSPAAVMVTHWESFFRSQLLDPSLSRATDLRQFARSLRRSLPSGAGWVMPLPRQTIRFRASERL